MAMGMAMRCTSRREGCGRFCLCGAATRLSPRRLGVCPSSGRWLADAGMNEIAARTGNAFLDPHRATRRHPRSAISPKREGRSAHIFYDSSQTRVTTEMR